MNDAEREQIRLGCTQFLWGHRPRSVREMLEEAAASPYALIKQDGYGKGGFVSELEADVAALLGKEAAAFMPSGTMAQPIALRIWADHGGSKRVAFHPTCHLEIHEQMGYRELHGLQAELLGEADRLFTLDDLSRVADPVSTLLIELPQREIGGQLPSWSALVAICDHARERGMRLHLDGARLWECRPFYDREYAEIAGLFDSVYVSFYKILGGLPGAILAGPADFIAEARIWQRRQGGNLQQQSPSAITARLGMDRELPRIAEYVAKAREIAQALRDLEGVRLIPEVPQVNMFHLVLAGDAEALVDAAYAVAREERCLLFPGLRTADEGARTEVTIGSAACEIPTERIRELFAKVLERTSVAPASSR
jgi:threonine aldolase